METGIVTLRVQFGSSPSRFYVLISDSRSKEIFKIMKRSECILRALREQIIKLLIDRVGITGVGIRRVDVGALRERIEKE